MMSPEEMLDHYRDQHENNSQFSRGTALLKHIPEIARLCRLFDCKDILDYGCGKAWFWQLPHWRAILDSADSVLLYDPGIGKYSEIPSGRFDCVICTDVLEHVR